jgi:hypothetical protein
MAEGIIQAPLHPTDGPGAAGPRVAGPQVADRGQAQDVDSVVDADGESDACRATSARGQVAGPRGVVGGYRVRWRGYCWSGHGSSAGGPTEPLAIALAVQSSKGPPQGPAAGPERQNVPPEDDRKECLRFVSSPLPCLPLRQFSSNFYSLRSSIKALCDAVDFDQRAFDKLPPRPALTERGEPFWDRSAAQRILRAELTDEDISSILNELEPREVRERHIEYWAFELAIIYIKKTSA